MSDVCIAPPHNQAPVSITWLHVGKTLRITPYYDSKGPYLHLNSSDAIATPRRFPGTTIVFILWPRLMGARPRPPLPASLDRRCGLRKRWLLRSHVQRFARMGRPIESHILRLVSSQEQTNVGALNPDEYVVIALFQIATIYTSFCRQNVTVYSCMRRHGALLMLPYDGLHEDVIRTKVFEDYIRDHVDSWFSLSKKKGLGVDRMEDLILVTGCTLVTSWGAAAFLDNSADAEFTLAVQLLNGGGATYDWRVIRPSVVHGDSYRGPVRPLRHSAIPFTNPSFRLKFAGNLPQNQCVFIRGFRAKRVFLWTRLRGAAEPLPDDPEPPSGPEGEIQVTRVADAPSVSSLPIMKYFIGHRDDVSPLAS
jgi:hypothetical protein